MRAFKIKFARTLRDPRSENREDGSSQLGLIPALSASAINSALSHAENLTESPPGRYESRHASKKGFPHNEPLIGNPISDLVRSSPDFGLAYRSRTRHGPNRQQIFAAAQFAELVDGQLWLMD